MESTESLVIGIISGILTSILLLLAANFINKILIPWYQTLIYRGVNISGTWIARFETVNNRFIENRFHLNQKGIMLMVPRTILNVIVRGIFIVLLLFAYPDR